MSTWGAVALLLVTAAAFAQKAGEPAPKWTITDARGLKKETKLEDFKGKWVVIDFFGHWCKPCVGVGLPHLMEFYEEHADQRDQFVIIAWHEPAIADFAALDKKLEPIEKKLWNGKKLPFPIVLDSSGDTLKAYNVRAFPTIVLIDPDGKIANVEVGARGDTEKLLASKLKKR
ncbi:MAG: TlpA family protein disulfide reductase [Phycisphaerae bacterium]